MRPIAAALTRYLVMNRRQGQLHLISGATAPPVLHELRHDAAVDPQQVDLPEPGKSLWRKLLFKHEEEVPDDRWQAERPPLAIAIKSMLTCAN
jgi:hypothetical protein